MHSSGEKATVLIADDNSVMRTFASHVVEKLGYGVVAVSNGDDAVARIEEGGYDVLLLDLSMPGKSGIEVLEYVVEHGYHLPVVMISGTGDIEQAVHCIKLGAYEYLTKPIDTNRLEITLKNALSESDLKQKVKLLTAAMEQSPVSIAITDTEGSIEYVNPSFSRNTGYSREEAMGENVNILKSGEHSDAFYKELWETITRGEVWQGEFHNKKKSGELFWEQAVISPVTIDAREISYFLALKEDITEQKRNREALAESEQRFRDLADLLPQPVFETDVRGNVTYSNRAGFDVFGYTPDDFHNGLNALQIYAPEERERVRENMGGRLSGSDVPPNEYTAQKKDGTRFPVLVYSAPIMRKGEVAGLRGIILDITHRKRVEQSLRDNQEKYRNLFQAVPDAVVVADADTGAIVEWNRTALLFFGYSEKELAAMNIGALYPDDLREEPPGYFRELAATKNGSVQTRIMTRDGFLVDVDVSTALVETARHKRVLGIFRDISEQKKSEQLIQENIRLKNDFISNVSHELRTPLFSILGFSSTLLRDRDDLDRETVDEFLGIIHEESTRLASLIEDVLTISRIDSGKVVFKKSPLDPAEILGTACRSMKIRADEKQVDLLLNLYGNAMQVLADGDALKQVAINLIGNAIKFTPPGGGVRASLVTENGFMRFSVQDDGPGIPEDDLEKIFDKFYRVEKPGEEIEGTGLGLSIVREIVHAHGGSVEAKNREGGGAIFIVRIPLFSSNG